MTRKKTIERLMGTSFLLLGLYLILTFANIAMTLGSRISSVSPITMLSFMADILAGITLVITAIVILADSKNAQ